MTIPSGAGKSERGLFLNYSGELESGFRALVKTVFGAGPARRRMEIRRTVWARRGDRYHGFELAADGGVA